MNGLYDDDPVRDAELAAEAYIVYERAVAEHLHELREKAAAIATARLFGVLSTAAEEAFNAYLDGIDPDLQRDMLVRAVWDGGRSVEREARTRLMRLRDANSLAGIAELGGA